MIKKILAVGRAGYIGGGTTEELIKQNIPFIVYDNLTYENHYLKLVVFDLVDKINNRYFYESRLYNKIKTTF